MLAARVPDVHPEWVGARRRTRGNRMTDVAKRSVVVLIIGFAAFYLLTQPESAANAIQGAFEAVVEAFHQIIRFFTALAD